MSAKMKAALSSYSDYGYNSEIEYADPHRLIQMLFEGALKRIAFAKGAMQRKSIEEKGKFISQTIEIVGGLRASLDMENGGDVAANLESLYEYISRRLLTANLENSEQILDEISGLLRDVKVAWDAINVPAKEQAETVQPKKDPSIPVEMAAKGEESKAITPPVEIKSNSAVKPVNRQVNKALKAYSI